MQDPMTGIYHVSRFQDVRHILARPRTVLEERKPRDQNTDSETAKGQRALPGERVGPF